MACDEYKGLLSALLDGELPPEERARVEAHLETCPECRQLLEELRALDTQLAALPGVAASPDFDARLGKRIRRPRILTFRPTMRIAWAAAAVVLVAVGLGLFLSARPDVRPPGQIAYEANLELLVDSAFLGTGAEQYSYEHVFPGSASVELPVIEVNGNGEKGDLS